MSTQRMSPVPPPAEAEGSLVPTEFLGVLWRRKLYLVVSLILFLAAGGAYLTVAPKKYLVTARLLLQRQGMPTTTDPDRELSTGSGFLATQAEIIRSPAVLQPVIETLGLQSSDPEQSDPMPALLETLYVRPMNPTNVLSISYRGDLPDLARETVKEIIASYQTYLRASETGSQSETVQLMTDYEKGLRQELDSLEKQYEELRKTRPLPNLRRETVETQKAKPEQLVQLNQLAQMLAAVQARRSAMENLVRPSVRSPAMERARAEEEHLTARYVEEYGKLRNADEETLRQLKATDEEAIKHANAVDDYAFKEQQIQGSIKRVKDMYDIVAVQMRQLHLAEQSLAAGRLMVAVRVLEAPSNPLPQTFPPTLVLIAMCALGGLGAGAGLALLVERIKATIQSPEQVQDRLALSVVGRIPAIKVPGKTRESDVRRSRHVCDLPTSPVADAFRGLRTRLAYGFSADQGWILHVTSPWESEGKTTIAANLAFSFAQLGKKVILLDADFHRGSHHEIFDVPGGRGLSAVLQDDTSLADAIVRSPLASVDVLPRGSNVTNPAELLAQPAFDQLLERLRHEYDVILVDGPPVLMDTAAQILAPKADEVLLCLRAGQSSMTDAVRTCEMLEALHKRPWGAVLNEVKPPRRYNKYYNSYATVTADPAADNAAPASRSSEPTENQKTGNGRMACST